MKVIIEQDEASLYCPYDESGQCIDYEGFLTFEDCKEWCRNQGYEVVNTFN